MKKKKKIGNFPFFFFFQSKILEEFNGTFKSLELSKDCIYYYKK